jgi:hypothetical protein
MRTNLFLERTFDEPLTIEDVAEGGRELRWCLDVHRCVARQLPALDGRTMICSFSPRTWNRTRRAARSGHGSVAVLARHRTEPESVTLNVVVERSFEAPVRFEDIKASARPRPGASTLTR